MAKGRLAYYAWGVDVYDLLEEGNARFIMSDDTMNDANRAKAKDPKEWANESFEKKLREVVRLQHLEYNLAQSQGRKCRKPWHSKKQKEA